MEYNIEIPQLVRKYPLYNWNFVLEYILEMGRNYPFLGCVYSPNRYLTIPFLD
jgi:hypothetical protein